MHTGVNKMLASRPPFGGISFEVGEPDHPPQHTAAHESLAACIGTWHAHGELDSGGEMRCRESYAWVPGEFFIQYHFDRDIGSNKHAGSGLIGYDAARATYFAFIVDNMGYARTYDVMIEDRMWTFVGKWERAMIRFEPDRNRMHAHWEHAPDGGNWKLLCEYEGTR